MHPDANTPDPPPAKTGLTRYRLLLIIIPSITLILGYLLAAVVTYLMPKHYESTGVIEIVAKSTPVEIPAEAQKLTNDKHLELVSHNLDLPMRWGVDHQSSVETLRESVTARPIPDTGLIRIRVRHTHREDARDIVNATIHAYRSIREGYDLEAIKRTLNELEMEIIQQDQVVYALREERMRQNANRPNTSLARPTELDSRYEEESLRLTIMSSRARAHPYPALTESQGGVLVHEEPDFSDSPVSPNIQLNLIIGVITGLLLGFPLALLIMAIFHSRRTADQT